MGARKFLVHHNHSDFYIDYDTDDGLEALKFQLYSLTSVPPHNQKIYGEKNLAVSNDSDLETIAEELRLVSLEDEEKEGEALASSSSDAAAGMLTDEELARILQAEEEEQFQDGENMEEFEERVRPYVEQVLLYEDKFRQEEARKTVPVDELEEKALVSLAKEGNFKPSKIEEDHAFLLQLLFWFNQSFRCSSCSVITRFPRYNDPLKLLETRRGRCGEWANCFTLYCRAFGYESRLILDFTDHVWTECFSHVLGRWMHLDACGRVYDNPLLYEKGWGKNLTYIIGIAKDGVYDVTRRYTRKWHEVLSRRNITTEPIASAVLSDITKECRKALSSHEIRTLEIRDRQEAEELEREIHAQDDFSISLPGRQSGAREWRIARSELGSNETSLSSSACPVRICVDDHVRNIYNAFSVLVSEIVINGIAKAATIKILNTLKTLLLDLRSTSFRVRSLSLNAGPDHPLFSVHQIVLPLDSLLDALSLKRETETGGKMVICLADDPVKTSIALPVALDALDDTIHTVNCMHSFGRESLFPPLLKSNRISSGSVLASGEELPFGIATSAFDGIHVSKWEEPNGGKGCWIIYKTKDGQMHDLEAYELMSANDAPERDPMDWIVEGSSDGGTSWNILDKQTSQMFDKRFNRRTFKIESVRQMSNAFKFRFLAVRDSKATSRFQIGSIDLYARSS
ncbi:hypothetical protein MRB53_030352 [Persea americana]|uniref:Uncharacterized protein n=1 Tax=Persea americana TaxID=3435 RepID=A0ACC2KLL3_PERAE|nr:hypothetical protein MRB53_030352 [Persea americana]